MGKKKDKRQYLNTTGALTLLKQVHLNGLINECVIALKKGKATVEAVDITTTVVFISNGVSIGSKRFTAELGLGNLDLLIKFLSTMQDPKLNVKVLENRMTLSRKDKRRSLEYLLSLPALIPTRLRIDNEDNSDPAEVYLETIEAKAEISQAFVKDFNTYITSLKTKIITILVKDSDVVFTIGPKSEHQFKLSLPLIDEAEDAFSVKINGEYFSKIVGTLEFNEDDDPVTIGFGDEQPVIIESEDALWAISPSDELEED